MFSKKKKCLGGKIGGKTAKFLFRVVIPQKGKYLLCFENLWSRMCTTLVFQCLTPALHSLFFFPICLPASFFLALALGVSSMSNVSNGKLSGRMKYRILLPLILNASSWTGSLFLMVIFTDFRCVFILTSTPTKKKQGFQTSIQQINL